MQFSKRIQRATLLDRINRESRKFLNKGGFSGILMTDLSKAFDCIEQELLIAKMHVYGFDIESLKFIDTSPEENREQKSTHLLGSGKWSE